MRKSTILILIFMCLLSAIIALTHSLSSQEYIELQKGENNIKINQTIYVKTLVMFNPEIEVVSYKDIYGKTIGFVNVFGGIGKNFLMSPEREYEIIVSEDSKLILPGEVEK